LSLLFLNHLRIGVHQRKLLRMARIKFTGPVSTVQLQPTPIFQGLLSKGDASAQTESQAEVDNISRSIVEESTALKQQQSLELVQIMLHVSVSTPGRI
jgi:meiosis-specific protein HOP1